jgi:hypothetical protein
MGIHRGRDRILHAMTFPAVVVSPFMSDEIYIGGARYVPAREIARTHGYVRNYVARLCREGKVAGRQLGRLWYVDAESFAAFISRIDNPARSDATQTMV